jgi:hypothetical protein
MISMEQSNVHRAKLISLIPDNNNDNRAAGNDDVP